MPDERRTSKLMNGHEYDALRLENQLCFPLYAAGREIVRLYKPYLDPVGLTYTQYIVMMLLWEYEEITVKELGKRLFLDSGTLTPVLKRIEKMGLVTRERSKQDERVLIVRLTDVGRVLKETAVQIPAQVGQCVPLAPEESEELYRLLYKLLGML